MKWWVSGRVKFIRCEDELFTFEVHSHNKHFVIDREKPQVEIQE
jgi:hypothetical protein